MTKTVFYTTESADINNNLTQRLTPSVKSPLDMRGEVIIGTETDGDYRSSVVNVGFLDQQLVNQSIAFRPNFLYSGTAGNMVSYAIEGNPNKYDFYLVINNQSFYSKESPVGDQGNFIRLPLDSFYVDHYFWTADASYRTGDLITYENRTYIVLLKHSVPAGTLFSEYYGFPLFRFTFELKDSSDLIAADETIDINGIEVDVKIGDDADTIAQRWTDAYNALYPDAVQAIVGSIEGVDLGIPNNVVTVVNPDALIETTTPSENRYNKFILSITGGTGTDDGAINDLLQLISNQATWAPRTRYYPGDLVVFDDKVWVAKPFQPPFISTDVFVEDNWVTAADIQTTTADNLDASFTYNDAGFVTRVDYGTLISDVLTDIKFYKEFTYDAEDRVTNIKWFQNEISEQNIDTILTEDLVVIPGSDPQRFGPLTIMGTISEGSIITYNITVENIPLGTSQVFTGSTYDPVTGELLDPKIFYHTVNSVTFSEPAAIQADSIITFNISIRSPFRDINFTYNADGFVANKDLIDYTIA